MTRLNGSWCDLLTRQSVFTRFYLLIQLEYPSDRLSLCALHYFRKKNEKKSTLTQRLLVDCCRLKDTSSGFFSRIYENNSYEPSDFSFSNLHNHPRAFCFPSLQKLPGFELPVVVNNLSFHALSICPLPRSLPKDVDGALRGA